MHLTQPTHPCETPGGHFGYDLLAELAGCRLAVEMGLVARVEGVAQRHQPRLRLIQNGSFVWLELFPWALEPGGVERHALRIDVPLSLRWKRFRKRDDEPVLWMEVRRRAADGRSRSDSAFGGFVELRFSPVGSESALDLTVQLQNPDEFAADEVTPSVGRPL